MLFTLNWAKLHTKLSLSQDFSTAILTFGAGKCLLCGGWSCAFRVFRSTPGLYPLNASFTPRPPRPPTAVTAKMLQTLQNALAGKGHTLPSWEPVAEAYGRSSALRYLKLGYEVWKLKLFEKEQGWGRWKKLDLVMISYQELQILQGILKRCLST